MEQVRWEDSGAVKHLGEAVKLRCTPKQEMLNLATLVPQKMTPMELGLGATRLKEGKSGKLKLHDR